MLPLIFDCKEKRLTAEERRFFASVNPYGFILFERNIETPEQVRALTDELREVTGRSNVPILIDQEGGRVARLKPPHWPKFPTGEHFAKLYAEDAAGAVKACRDNARAIAEMLADLGITVNCAPVADLPVDGAHNIIGDRAYGKTVAQVVALARACADGHLDAGVIPVVKHIPGHGRARADSHEKLPVVDTPLAELETSDFAVFKQLNDIPMAMTAHVHFTALDKEKMVTVSPSALRYIREKIGFNGLIMSDAISMNAMGGTWVERMCATLAAGCDVVLACNGFTYETTVDLMQEMADACPPFIEKGLKRAEKAMAFAA